MTYQNIVCFQLNLIFFFFFGSLLPIFFYLCYCCSIWHFENEIYPLLAITSIDLNWYQLPTAEAIRKIIAYDCHCKHSMLCNILSLLFCSNGNPHFWGRRLDRSTAAFFSVLSFEVQFCWHPNICPINCILSLCQFLIEKHKIVQIHSVNQSIRSKTQKPQHQMDYNKAELNNFLVFVSMNQMCPAEWLITYSRFHWNWPNSNSKSKVDFWVLNSAIIPWKRFNCLLKIEYLLHNIKC